MAEGFLKEYKKNIDSRVKEIQKRILKEKNRKCVSFSGYLISKLKKEAFLAVKKAGKAKSIKDIEIKSPPAGVKGDFCFSVFSAGKQCKKNPLDLAKETADILNNGDGIIKRAETAGPYVNFDVKKEDFFALSLKEIEKFKENYGKTDINKKKIAIIDYSSPNVAKPIGVGHLRSTIIGKVLANIYEETGFSCVKENWVGDWGTQFGKVIYAYQNWADKAKVAQNPIEELKNLYIEFHKKAKENPELQEKARKIFSNLEKGDKELFAVWEKIRELSIKDFEKAYSLLGVDFDIYTGEAYFASQSEDMIKDCLKKKICQKKDLLVFVENISNLPSFLLRKEDGSTLYITRDLATIRFRVKKFKPEAILYVVGKEQELHLKQLFALAGKIGYLPKKTKAKHIDFGLVLSDGKKMSTREGNIINLQDLLDEAVLKSEEILREKNPKLEEEEIGKISKIIGIGSILYGNLRQSRQKNISFDWDRMLSLENGSSVYLQYVFVRINSILNKINEDLPGQIIFKEDIEFELAKKLSFFPEVIARAQQNDAPHFICVYLEELAQISNSFYEKVSVLKTEEKDLKNSRLLLLKSVSRVLERGLGILNIGMPEKM